MSEQPFMTVIMCDDVRREEGHKVSYMGVYGPTLLLQRFPAVLPKLCFVMTLTLPGSYPLPSSLVFRLVRDEEPVGEVTMDGAALAAAPAELLGDGDGMRHVIGAVLQFHPMPIEGPCMLRARADLNGEELKGGSWRVALAQ